MQQRQRTAIPYTMRLPVVCLTLLMFAACGGGDSVPGPDVSAPPCCKQLPGPDEIGHSPVLTGSTVIADNRHLLIRDNAAWQAFLSEYHGGVSPAAPLPPIDFSTSMLAGVIAAQLPNDCYFINARRVLWAPSASAPDHIDLTYAVQPPGIGCVVHQAPVSRMFLEAMLRSELPVAFVLVE